LLSSWKYRTFRETLGYSRGEGGGLFRLKHLSI
jgi:hypothetical protein